MPRLPRVAKPIPAAEPRLDALLEAVRFPHTRDFEWLQALRLTDGTRIDVFVHTFTGRVLRLGDDGASSGLTPSGRFKQGDLEDDVWWAIPHQWEWLKMGGYAFLDVPLEPWPEDDPDEDAYWDTVSRFDEVDFDRPELAF